jgi:23S rRNA (guanosine2251-2'-O)-methyltransferase
VRTLYAAGVNGLVLRPRNWLSAAAVVTRASAGATEWMPTAVAETAEEAAAFYRQAGLAVACTSQQTDSISIYKADLTTPLFLLLGGEKRGITRSFLAQADLKLEIPYGREQFQQSLGTVAAAAILSFEIRRQRLQKPL